MTEEQKRIVDDLREECNGCGGFDSEYGICMLDECMGHKSADMIEQLSAEFEQVKRERDAMLVDMKTLAPCDVCMHKKTCCYISCEDCKNTDCVCREECPSTRFSMFRWRGPCKENGGAEDEMP